MKKNKIPNGYFCVLCKEKKSKTIAVHFPAHPGIITYGHDWEEAVEMAREALSALLETEFERGQVLPKSTRPKVKNGDRLIFIPIEPEIKMAYLLRTWREDSGLTQKQLAQKLGVSYQAYQRMERPGRSNLTVSTLQKIANSLDKELVLSLN
ncbi:MAG: type II toxin-antitoxin system HicB family antitoxin [Deltaproteobacteria bacterium]|nr:type II toxin-antitoxin system HicB family antitoxin [Deltaproteobacteria bacterium]